MKIEVALSGGGARCLAQLGYLDVLWRMGVEFTALAGSSGGSIAAAFLAQGMSPEEAFKEVLAFDFSTIRLNLFKGSIFTLEAVAKEFEKMGLRDFQALKVPLSVTLTRYENGEVLYKKEGDLARSLIASSALIPIFAPVEVEGEVYIDGGFGDNLPVRALPGENFTVAINVNPLNARFKPTFTGHFKKACYILFNNNVKHSIPLADRFVQIEEAGKFGILDKKHLRVIYEIGKEQALRDQKGWQELCSKNS